MADKQQRNAGLRSGKEKFDNQDNKGTPQIADGGKNGGANDVFFIIPRKVTVLYGPYMFQGMMDYRTERLQGLKAFLEKLGVSVELTPCLDHVNLCRIWFLDEPIFSCKMTDLIFGCDGELDPVCWQAAESLENYIKKVLKGLQKQKPLMMTSEEVKKPFCPCFQVDQNRRQRKSSIRSSTTGKSRRSSSGFSEVSATSGVSSTEVGGRSNRNSEDVEELGKEDLDNNEKRIST